MRILYGGSVKPDNARRAARAAGRRRRARRRREPRCRRASPRSRARRSPADEPRPVALVILDGFGLAPDGPGQRRRAGAHARLRRALGALPAHDADRLRARRRAARGADGQLRGRATSTSAPAGSSPQDLVRIGDAVADGSLASNPALRRPSPRRAPGAACCTSPGSSPTAACTRTSTTCARSCGAALARRRPARRRARLHRRPRRLAAPGRGPARRSSSASGRAPAPSSRPSSAATTPWIATTAVERTELARAAMVDGVGEHADVGVGRASRRATRAGSPTSSSSRSCSATPGCASRRAIRSSSSTSAPTARARSATRSRRRSACSSR